MDLSLAECLVDSNQRIDINNNFKIVAGPGAGKTTFLVNHIKNIIDNSFKISALRKIACITYTNVGADSIISKLGDAYESTEVSTIHSFLYKHVVKPYLWVLTSEYKFDLENINGHDEVKPTYSILKQWKKLSKQPYLNDNKKLSLALSKLTWIMVKDNFELNLPINGYSKIGEYYIKKESYIEYKKTCWEKGLLSHDDILYLSYIIIKKNKRILDIIRNKFPYILVDEFQDTNPVQTKIIELISKEESIIGVIGDDCQSIYGFQGAKVKQFVDFDLENMKLFTINDNRRSTIEIINLLNYMRDRDSIKQKSPEKLHGEKPLILIGDIIQSYEKVKELINEESVYTLSYKKNVSKKLEYGVDSLFFDDEVTSELLFNDSERGQMIFYIISSIEYSRQSNFKEAMKCMKKAYRNNKEFSDKNAIENIKRLIENYNIINSLDLKELYNNYIYNFYKTKRKLTSGKKEKYYKTITYNQVASMININDNLSKYRTIHKAKGDEFENVLVLINPLEFNESKDLSFILQPDMTKEEHRVYYVALSRAKKRLFISIPSISEDIKEQLEKLYFFDILTI